jgi:dTDP-4-dehydrorhamnose 3,5-epimerase
MIFTPARLQGAFLVKLEPHRDERGFFARTWCRREFAEHGLIADIAQTSISFNSRAGTLRGLHYQRPPHPQGKLVRVTQGAAFDVAVDIRRGSPSFGQWTGALLSAANRRQLWIPEGFAHGFLALEDDTHFLYKTTDVYALDCEGAVRWNDPAIGIDWPLDGLVPRLAAKDAEAPLLGGAELPPFAA